MHHIPTHGLGTFRLKDDVLKHSLKTGLDVGFRHIDTAQIYENEREIGDILQSLDYRRENLFLTSKIWTSNLSRSKLLDSLKQSLLDLKTDYLDLTLIHWPSPKNEVPLKESLTELMHAKEQGLTKSIGISNFTIKDNNNNSLIANGTIVANGTPRQIVNTAEAKKLYFGEDFTI